MNKFSVLIFFLVFGLMACGGDKKSSTPSSDSKPKPKSESASSGSSSSAKTATNRKGKLVYKQYCVTCHGMDGKLNVSGAKDLSVSTISREEATNQVTNGKGLMTPYKDILSEEQIAAVVEYIEELRQ